MTDYLETVRQALDRFVQREPAIPFDLHEDLRLILDAARRLVRLAETGPDYEAAMERFKVVTGDIDGVSPGDVRSIVDAAVPWLSDYTEEET